MDEPRDELKANEAERADAPDFDALVPPEDAVRGERTRDDFLDAVLTLDSPATAGDVAELAGHGVDAAREYLEWFERMGVVTKATDSPATYERNQEYLDWRRVQRLRREYTTEELLDLLEEESEHLAALRREFDVDAPTDVSIARHAEATDRSVEAVWERLTAWQTARRRVALLERALAAESGDAADRRSAV
ncbi:putative ArsR family transcriptional regulator [Halorubrum trapanicum]|uniref:Putative ArsR family transcriptional regulator n=1 Tax=Halorubrum trapanicum TaxID=29284 RepID=A0A8J7R8L6_9EURY|nr:hypothetical protein [Halorubrum trapanicum]MBP1902264.1 putative ArsR family transcriptional regulator [Halorubrum trapanicum]